MSPELIQSIITILGSVLGSGAAVTLIKFFVERKDKKAKEAKEEKKEESKNNLDELRKEFNAGLQERENKGAERYAKHEEDISQLIESIGTLTKDINENSNALKLVGNSLLGLEHDRIIFLTDKIAKRKCITLKEKATLEALYLPYAALGGNGDCKVGYNYCSNLPVVTDLEADKLDLDIKKKDLGIAKRGSNE